MGGTLSFRSSEYWITQKGRRMFDLYTLLRSSSNSFVNMAIASEDYKCAVLLADHEVMNTDPRFAWISSILPLETQIRGACPVQNYFIKGILSNEASAAFHLTALPNQKQLLLEETSALYGLKDLVGALLEYSSRYPGFTGTPSFSAAHVWFKFRVQLHSVFDESIIMPSQLAQAYSPSKEFPWGNCDTVLLAGQGKDPYVVQVQAVLVPIASHGVSLLPSLLQPLLYIQYFKVIANPSDHTEVKRMLHGNPQRQHERFRRIVPLAEVAQAVELIPLYGPTKDPSINATNSLEVPTCFLLNCYSDKEVYCSMLVDD
ncbi:hypothetical protein SERLA73DRAFT_175986 [Serpula lacrymans var. lacrymans S7.3]|uniref:DUF6830 domain-containing protein n=2 Tax=Serpula lacrymans var. lacrymans TaxID=341189 RepID=F8PLU5_SERL3|nr:uncharacterized protein SERLADRAFT_458680 [Serpula lacrymans var. lacrymans S7.9]EGO02577.1 hypothetical protein SERLA73DRAFT_175986 [Serpula lacrymans var. lacrymans S7.3]EGO28295.1 hypothetical protein SERLADRAFT_458680 [Serpula lacrymans var. lacrymans S7.9]